MREQPLILIVDDDRSVHMTLTPVLAGAGFEIHSAYSGEEGLRMARSFQPRIVILDVIMPKMDGFEVLKRLKANARTAAIPVIMLTAKPETSSILKAQGMKATDYVVKPFDADNFLRVIQRHV